MQDYFFKKLIGNQQGCIVDELNNINQLGIIEIFRTFCLQWQNTYYFQVHVAVSKIDYMPSYEANCNTFKRTAIR